jgi:hypothetical protein
MSDPHADACRRRADQLRAYARHLDATPMDDLLRWSGTETWFGPLADELALELRRDRDRLADAADDLRRHARRLDAEAEELEERARLAAAVVPGPPSRAR